VDKWSVLPTQGGGGGRGRQSIDRWGVDGHQAGTHSRQVITHSFCGRRWTASFSATHNNDLDWPPPVGFGSVQWMERGGLERRSMDAVIVCLVLLWLASQLWVRSGQASERHSGACRLPNTHTRSASHPIQAVDRRAAGNRACRCLTTAARLTRRIRLSNHEVPAPSCIPCLCLPSQDHSQRACGWARGPWGGVAAVCCCVRRPQPLKRPRPLSSLCGRSVRR
jgi:hypothetical protein